MPTSVDRCAARGRTLLLMCVGYFLVQLDVTIVNVALPDLARTLDAGVAGLQWVVDGYTLPLAALLLSAGTLGDLRGHRRLVLIGLVLFGAASLGCGLAPSAGVLVAARAVQGVGAAVLLPGTLAIIARTFPDPAGRARAIGVWVGVGSVALPAGPLLGGLLVETLGWRAVFLVDVPIVAVAVVATARLVGPDEPALAARRPDVPGTVLAAVALAAVTFAVVEAGRGGLGGPVGVGVAVAVVAAVAFVRAERTVPDPMLPPALFRRPAFLVANLASAAMNMGNMGLLFLCTPLLQVVRGLSPLTAGAALLPLFVPVALAAPLAGRAAARVGLRSLVVAGLLVAAAGAALLAGLPVDGGYPRLVPALLLWGVGVGVLTPSVVAVAVGAVPTDHAGLASGVNNALRQAGGAVGIAAFGAAAGPAAADPARFVAALGVCGLATAGVWGAAAVLVARYVPRAQAAAPSREGRRP